MAHNIYYVCPEIFFLKYSDFDKFFFVGNNSFSWWSRKFKTRKFVCRAYLPFRILIFVKIGELRWSINMLSNYTSLLCILKIVIQSHRYIFTEIDQKFERIVIYPEMSRPRGTCTLKKDVLKNKNMHIPIFSKQFSLENSHFSVLANGKCS